MKNTLVLLILLCHVIITPKAGLSDDLFEITYASAKWAPYSWRDDQGKPRGIYIDLLHAILGDELGYSLRYLELPWKRAQHAAKSGQADILITVMTEERLAYSTASRIPLIQLHLHIFTYANHPKLQAINSITTGEEILNLKLTPVTNIGNHWHKQEIDKFGINTLYVNDEESAFKMVANRRADITIEPIYAGAYLISNLGLSDKITMTNARFGPINMHLLFSKKSPHISIFPKINKAMVKLHDDGTFEEILARYAKVK